MTDLRSGDCLAILPTLPDGAVDAVLFDPPYGIEHSSNYGASWAAREIANDSDTAVRDGVIAWAESRRIPWACFGTWERPRPQGTRGILVWDKGPAFGMGDLSFPWKKSWEEIYIGGRGWRGKRDEGVIRGHIVVSWESKGRVHPHQKPATLIEYILSKLPDARTILDPTMGSGTTGVACVRKGFDFIGIEIDPEVMALARDRISAEGGRHPLFDGPRTRPQQAGLFA